MTTLAHRKVLVVGASAGVGQAFAQLAIDEGAEVVVAARRVERLDELVARPGATHPVSAVAADISRDDDCRNLVDAAVAALGSIDLVFHAVGLAPLAPLADTDADAWRTVLETNVIGLQRVLAGAVPHIVPGGIVAVLSSETVGRPRPGLGAYGASKAALSESLRAWRLEHPDVRFSCVALGATQPTEFGDAFDMDVLLPVLDTWFQHGLMQRDYMDTGDVAAVLAATLGSALAFPGVSLEDLVLRSPSPIVSGFDQPS